MKTLVVCLVLSVCAASAPGTVFQMDRKGNATVEVVEVGAEYRVTCRFVPQTKFNDAVNARFNDAKGDDLCKKGIARYLKASTNEVVTVSGQYSAAPVKVDGGKLCYSFGVPIAGCSVTAAPIRPVRIQPARNDATNELPAVKGVPVLPMPVVSTSVVKKVTVEEKSYVCVTKYKEVNGHRTMVSQREYRGCDFKSPEAFDSFCQNEFARIRALGEANLKAVRDMAEKNR